MVKSARPRAQRITLSERAVRKPGWIMTWLMRAFVSGLPRRIG